MKAAIRYNLSRRTYATVVESDAMVTAYLYLLQQIERGVYDILPKEKQ